VCRNIIGILGPGGEGGTFLDWSLHYLSGENNHHCILVDRDKHVITGRFQHTIVDNPITLLGNAHLHLKTHPTERTFLMCAKIFERINDANTKLKTMYIVPTDHWYSEGNGYRDFVKSTVSNSTEMKFIQFYHPDEMLHELTQRIHTKIPDFSLDVNIITQHVSIACSEDRGNKIINLPNVYSIDIKKMFYDLDSEIHKIFTWLDISIDQSRYSNWLTVYKQWQFAQNFCTTN
jgi:hypothetical protein